MKTAEQIQKAHDILHGFIVGDVAIQLDELQVRSLHAAHDCLAWVADGPCGGAFKKNLDALCKRAKELGYELRNDGDASATHGS